MKRLLIIVFMLVSIFAVGCNKSQRGEDIKESEILSEKVSNNIEGNSENEEKIKVAIKSNEINFYDGSIKFTPSIEGVVNKGIQYHWILESEDYIDGKFYSSENDFEGFVSNEGPVKEIINNGESVEFGVYAEVSYVDGAYSENKVILQIEEKDTGNILAKDEAIIENRMGMYFVKTSEEENLKNEILKSDKAKIYAEIFDIIWTIDSGLNTEGQYINVDTKSFEDFTEEDKSQLFEYLSKKYNKTILDKTFEELEAEGYIKEMTFRDGMMFKANKYLKNSENEISFEGMKWVSGIGAIGFIAEAEKNNDRWIIKKCYMTWIS